MFESIKALFRKAPEKPRLPPTPEDTARAQGFMRLILQTMDEGYQTKMTPDAWVSHYVNRPARWLQMAYEHDPNATVKDSDGHDRTQDDIAGELHYNEAKTYANYARSIRREQLPITPDLMMMRQERRMHDARVNDQYTLAYIAAIQAARFRPNYPSVLRLLYTTSAEVGDKKRAAATMKTLMEIDPNHPDTLALL